jgi:hypothetical protein
MNKSFLKTHMHFRKDSSALVTRVLNPQEKRMIPPTPRLPGSKCVCTNTLNHYLHVSLMPKREDHFYAFQT